MVLCKIVLWQRKVRGNLYYAVKPKNQILLQAGTAMLAQANMAPQQVLSLFG
jgi:hypothetical protein